MAVPRKTIPNHDRTLIGRLRGIVAVALSLGLASCADPAAGGGTELPIQVRIYVDAEAKAWRLWTIEDTPSAGRGSATGRNFISRGILRDSAGILSLPATAGTFLLESWVNNNPPESLVVVHAIAEGFRLDETCIQAVPLDRSIVRTQVCPGLDRSLAPSATDSASRPERLTLIRIEGQRVQRVQILDDAGGARLDPVEARLWEVSRDSGQDQTLHFRGVLDRESDGTLRLPTSNGFHRYLIEAAGNGGALPRSISTSATVQSGWTRFMDCQESILPPLPTTLSIHSCPGLDWTLSGTGETSPGANLWSVFSLDLP